MLDVPAVDNQSVLSRDNVLSHDDIPTMNHTPSHRSKSLIQASSVLDFGQIDDSIRLNLDILHINGSRQNLVLLKGNRLDSETKPARLPINIVRALDIRLAGLAQRALGHGNRRVGVRKLATGFGRKTRRRCCPGSSGGSWLCGGGSSHGSWLCGSRGFGSGGACVLWLCGGIFLVPFCDVLGRVLLGDVCVDGVGS
ncbi:hypothetical protein HG531_005564 [Fusarium graminearum]|nr:hypothetical protein HG531_005564 [Fusarium graminearum]